LKPQQDLQPTIPSVPGLVKSCDGRVLGQPFLLTLGYSLVKALFYHFGIYLSREPSLYRCGADKTEKINVFLTLMDGFFAQLMS
jgi:hypothetical protein